MNYYLISLVPKAGLEPARSCPLRILSPVRLPFRHFGMCKLLIIWFCKGYSLFGRRLSALGSEAYASSISTQAVSGKRRYSATSACVSCFAFLMAEGFPPIKSSLEVPPRFELGNKGFADLCLTTWRWYHWSGRRDSNPRHLPWQGNALPLSHSRKID